MANSHDTLKFDDQRLTEIAALLDGFVSDYLTNYDLVGLKRFAAGGTGLDGTDNFTLLLAGADPLTDAKPLQTAFLQYCTALKAALDSLSTFATDLKTRLAMAGSILMNGEQDALTVAQMLQLLESVYSGLGSTTPPPK